MRPLIWAAVLLVCLLCLFGFAYSKSYDPITRGSVVKIVMKNGHGSAVHVGSGYLISAAHVVANGEYSVKLDDGTVRTASTLWANSDYDIALLKLDDFTGIESSSLKCRTPHLHEQVTARGNPLNLEWITTRGWIAGEAREVGRWKSVAPMSLPLAGGMSGGGLFDANGYLVGILVGVPVQRMGMGGTFVGMAYAVDGKAICILLARA